MKILIEMLAALVAALAAAALSQFGIDLVRQTAQVEIQRLPACAPAAPENDSGSERTAC